MSDTPRTDAHQAACLRSGGRSVVLGENAYWLCRQLEREVQQCKEIVWQAALAQSGRCGITERLLLRLYNDMERISSANARDQGRLPEAGR
jgi:hypothetical protein